MNQEQGTTYRQKFGWCAAAFCLFGVMAVSASAQQKQLPDGPGKEAVERVCNGCHGAEIVLGRGLTRDGWGQIVSDIIGRGAQGSEDDFAQIVDYLAKNFPPASDAPKKMQALNKLFADAERGKDPVQDIVRRGSAGNRINGS